MIQNHQYSEGELVIAKLGTNPWWPGTISTCSKTNKCFIENESSRQVFVKLLEINTETWIEIVNVLNCTSKHEMELYLSQLQINSPNSRYLNNVPSAMVDVYNKSWKLYEKMQKKKLNYSEKSKDNEILSGKTIQSEAHDENLLLQPCEICMTNMIEFDCVNGDSKLLTMNPEERKEYFSKMLIDNKVEKEVKCTNYCVWKYHERCAIDENALICSCNKSVWMCSICDQQISVAQLFVCNSHECMRPFHRSCLSWHLEMAPPDMRQCPLHQCVNCSLDGLMSDGVESQLVYCVKCKIAFHDDPDCLPSSYVSITPTLIICHRHLVDVAALRSNVAGFCFACGIALGDDQCSVSCKYCLVTYHNTAPCLSTSMELIDEQTFVCNGCKFPFARRASYPVLTVSVESGRPGTVHDWKFGLPVPGEAGSRHQIVTRDANDDQQTSTDMSKTIGINLQSLDHLAFFGLLRFNDMQRTLRYLAAVVAAVRDRLKLRQVFYRNAFVLLYSGLFPVTENVVLAAEQPRVMEIDSEKCRCTDYCTTKKCPNVASSTECTSAICCDVTRCRNRRLQKRHYPRCSMHIDSQGATRVILEEAVVKDILVVEIVGQVVLMADCVDSACAIPLGAAMAIDCSEFCNIARFFQTAARPNLQPKQLTVAGTTRIGLFSTRRIVRGENLTVGTDLFCTGKPSSEFTSWQAMADAARALRTEQMMVDTSDDPTDRTVVCTKRDSSAAVRMSRAPLCPICLEELVANHCQLKVLIHCKDCFTVFHMHCARTTLYTPRAACGVPLASSLLLNYVCPSCACPVFE